MTVEHTQPLEASSVDALVPPETVRGIRGTFEHLRDNAKSILGDTREFLIRAALRMRDFRSMVFPHIKYFYAIEGEGEDDSFLNRVINAEKREIEGIIAQSLDVLRADEEITNDVMAGIERSFEIPRRVEEIIDIIEAIEIHSVNTMIISKKTGIEGEALARISYEMGNLSRDANEVSSRFAALIKDLNDSFEQFGAMRKEQAEVYERYLARFRSVADEMFEATANELVSAADDVIRMVGAMDGVDSSIRGVIDRISIEDVLRQDIEKIIFLTDELASGFATYFRGALDGLGPGRLTCASLAMMSMKVGTIARNLDMITQQASRGFSGVRDILTGSSFAGGEGRSTIPRSLHGMDAIYGRIESIREGFSAAIEKIIGGRRALYDTAGRVLGIVSGFGAFFDQIGAIARRFEIITMITRIELARHHELRSALEGTLAEVSSLPREIKRIVDGLNELYGAVMDAMRSDMERYSTSFEFEERRLREGMEAIGNVADRVAESRAKYRQVLEQIDEKSAHFLHFIGQEEERFSRLRGIRASLDDVSAAIEAAPCAGEDAFRSRGDGEIEAIKRSVADAGEQGDYRRMMLLSLLGEMREGAEQEEGSTTFF